MFSAWLEEGRDGFRYWTRTACPTKTFQHEGRFIICDTEADDAPAVEKIQELTGKYAFRDFRHHILVRDVPIYDKVTPEVVELAIKGVACVVEKVDGLTNAAHEFVSVYLHPTEGVYVDSQLNVKYDVNVWRKCWKQKKKKERDLLNSPPLNKYLYETVMQTLARNLGMVMTRDSRTDHLLLWITLHDKMKGKRATNKIVKPLATSWAKHHKKQRNRFKSWINEDILTQIEERLQSIVKFKN